MSNSAPPASYESPLQLKGEVMDLDFTLDSDHRKRRRNRTTQSCLNCHTSKRKCDRKRPCQRCIQLGLTGLCVYEIDDPASRDDPTLDESTRLRNRIAELESLVRELRGKPHPRWADGKFRDGDQSERWHSRAAKYSPQAKRGGDSEGVDQDTNGRLPSIKVEPHREKTRSPVYDFSPSPNSSMPYADFQSGVPSPPILPYDNERRQSFGSDRPRGSLMSYSSSSMSFHHQHHPDSASSYSNGSSGYDASDLDDDRVYAQRFAAASSPAPQFCACRTSPAMVHALIPLNHQLQNATNALRQYGHHSPDSQCLLYRRIVELNNLMHGGNSRASPVGPSATYGPGALPTPETDIMSPLSSSGSPFDPPSVGNPSQDWTAIAAAGYNPYFPLNPGENSMFDN